MTSITELPVLLRVTPQGLYCPPGNFHVDPWGAVGDAVITHGHGDHLRSGSARYHLARAGESIAAHRLPGVKEFVPVSYGERFRLGETTVSLHPAGHVLGSAQVRIEHEGRVWVVSGDYKRQPDPTCAAFEPLACDVFVSEATFALPIYRWPPTEVAVAELVAWWHANREQGIASLVFCYSLGKAQRLLAELRAFTEEAVHTHGAVETITALYRSAGIAMVPTVHATTERKQDYAGALVLAPPSAAGSPWMRRFGEHSSAFCSGWMRVRGDRRRRGYDRGFVVSDHADWDALLETCLATGARRVLLTHGHSDAFARYLRERGIDAGSLETAFGAEE